MKNRVHAPRLSLLGLLGLGALTASTAHAVPPLQGRAAPMIIAQAIAPPTATVAVAVPAPPPSVEPPPAALVPFAQLPPLAPARYAGLARVRTPVAFAVASKPTEIETGVRTEGVDMVSLGSAPVPVIAQQRNSRARRITGRLAQRVRPASVAMPTAPRQLEIKGSPDTCLAVQLPGRELMLTSSIVLSDEGVVPMRLETLHDEAGGAYLDQVDAWIDTKNHGALSAGHRKIPLTLVGRGPYGAEAFAYVEQTAEGEQVRVLMTTYQSASIEEGAPDEHQVNCSMASFTLRRQRSGTTALGTLQRGVMVRDTVGQDPSTNSYRVGVSLSLSQFSADPEPVLSVTMRALDEPPPGIPVGRLPPQG
jgi:hypothetical protein